MSSFSRTVRRSLLRQHPFCCHVIFCIPFESESSEEQDNIKFFKIRHSMAELWLFFFSGVNEKRNGWRNIPFAILSLPEEGHFYRSYLSMRRLCGEWWVKWGLNYSLQRYNWLPTIAFSELSAWLDWNHLLHKHNYAVVACVVCCVITLRFCVLRFYICVVYSVIKT